MATIKTPNHRPQMATVRPRSTKPLEARNDRLFVVEEVSVSPKREKPSVEVLGLRGLEGQGGSIEEADIVISGGKGLKKRDNFVLIERLAKAFGAEVGASRDAVDRGWASYPHQVGLSGKKPSLPDSISLPVSLVLSSIWQVSRQPSVLWQSTAMSRPISLVLPISPSLGTCFRYFLRLRSALSRGGRHEYQLYSNYPIHS